MSCCGRRRQEFPLNGKLAERAPVARAANVLLYEYTGTTGMTVVGSITGHTYRFGAPGARVQIDSRDVASLGAVPHLRCLGRA